MSSQAELLPRRTHISTLPSIADWRRTQAPHVGKRDIRMSGFKLSGRPQRGYSRKALIRLDCVTRNEENWTTRITPEVALFLFKPQTLTIPEINDIAEQLTLRQRLYIPQGVQEDHDKGVDFVARNWGYLRRQLYPNPVEGRVPPFVFTEVLTNHKTGERADLVGLGPDGRLFVIEFGKDKKFKQVQKYVDGLRKSFSDFKLSITPFVAYYDSGNKRRLLIKPPYKDHMGENYNNVNRFITRQKKNPRVELKEPKSNIGEFEQFVTRLKKDLNKEKGPKAEVA